MTRLRTWLSRTRAARPRRRWTASARLLVEGLEDRTLLSAPAGPLTPLVLGSPLQAVTMPGEVDYFTVTLPNDGRLTAQVAPGSGVTTRLSLLTPDGMLLSQSAGQSATDPEDRLTQFLSAGDYVLEVDGRTGRGAYTVTASFAAAALPLGHNPIDSQGEVLATGDFNGDGRPDLAVGTQSGLVDVLLGLGDGAFAPAQTFPTDGQSPFAITTANLNADGHLDLVVAQGDTVAVLLGNGDGTFQAPQFLAAGPNPRDVVAADFNGDGRLDLAVAGGYGGPLVILLGNGDGTFQAPQPVPGITEPVAVTAGDFFGDGRLDLAVACGGLSINPVLVILHGQGDGTFALASALMEQASISQLLAVDLNGDGRLDLLVPEGGDARVLLNQGGGFFQQTAVLTPAVGGFTSEAQVGDFNGDGRLDVALGDLSPGGATVFLGQGDGTFSAGRFFPTHAATYGLVTADFDRDGRPDLALTGIHNLARPQTQGTVQVLRGLGDGLFQAQPVVTLAGLSGGAVAVDLNNDGVLDFATTDLDHGQVTVWKGVGDGTFVGRQDLPIREDPRAIGAGDFNGDGRPDLVAANSSSNTLSLLLGLGDGTFQARSDIPVGNRPFALVTGDFNGDGRLDVAATCIDDNTVEILLGRGDGTFAPPQSFAVDAFPASLVAGDFNGDGHLDVAAVCGNANTVDILLGKGDGTFGPPEVFTFDQGLGDLVAGDFNGDGHLDLALSFANDPTLWMLAGNGDGTFQAPQTVSLGPDSNGASGLVAADFNGDGRTDLAANDFFADTVSVFWGGAALTPGPVLPVGSDPVALMAGDFNNDGRTDLVVLNGDQTATPLLGGANGTFFSPGRVAAPVRTTPVVLDGAGPGTADVAVLNSKGQILYRRGRPGSGGQFDPPVVVNPDPSAAARDLAAVRTTHGQLLAALNAQGGRVSLYSRRGDGTFRLVQQLELPADVVLPSRLAAGDLNDDGLDDLVVAAAGSDEVLVYRQHADGTFGPTPDVRTEVGASPSALRLDDLDGDGRLDIVVSDYFSGDVTVLLNDAAMSFQQERRYPASRSLRQMDPGAGPAVVHSPDRTVDLVTGRFTGGPLPDVLALNAGTQGFALLPAAGAGDLLAPRESGPVAGAAPFVAASADFNGDGLSDLAVLDQATNTISVYLSDGHGGFTPKVVTDAQGRPVPLSAGNAPDGLVAFDLTGDGIADLLVGNSFGDLLVLPGNGDGTFRPYQRTDRAVTFAVGDLAGDGQKDFIVANKGADRVSVQQGGSASQVLQDRSNGIQAPGAVQLVDLNGDHLPDLIVANSGGNSILVYPGLGDGRFGPVQTYHVGTNPTGLSLADVNGDGLPDVLVADQGSNDVTVLLANPQARGRTDLPLLTLGPRLQVGNGPVAVTTVPNPTTGRPDLLVTDQNSNDVRLLPNVGNGFFDDRPSDVTVFQTGQAPTQTLVGHFTGGAGLDLVTLNGGSNNLTFFQAPSFQPGAALSGTTVDAGGTLPETAVVGDFLHNGVDDLIVGNEGSGTLAVFLGGADGPSLKATLSNASLLHPTDLAVAAVGTNGVQLYVAQEGQDSVAAVSFTFDVSGIPVPAGPPPGVGTTQPGTALVALDESALALVAVLVTGLGEVEGGVHPTGAAVGGAVEGSNAAATTATAAGSGSAEEASGEEPAAELQQAAPESDAETPVMNFLNGLQQAIEQPPALKRGEVLDNPGDEGSVGPEMDSPAEALPGRNDVRASWPSAAEQASLALAAHVPASRSLPSGGVVGEEAVYVWVSQHPTPAMPSSRRPERATQATVSPECRSEELAAEPVRPLEPLALAMAAGLLSPLLASFDMPEVARTETRKAVRMRV